MTETPRLLGGVILRAARAANQFCRDRAAGTLKPRREWKAGRPEAFAAALRYLTHANPDVVDEDDRLTWRTADGTITVPTEEEFVTDMTLTVTDEDFGAQIRLRDPVALATAILSAWMCLDHPEGGRIS